jgi:hypothetical protein
MLSDRADAALIALTLPAMSLGAQIQVEGVVTDELAFAYDDVQALYAATGRGESRPVTFSHTAPATPRATGVATGFSAGIDSFAVLAEHHYASRIPDSQRVTHLLFNNVGSQGGGQRAVDLGSARLTRIEHAAHQIGLPLIDVTSNLDDFYHWPLWFFRTHTPRNASVAHLLSCGVGTFFYASAFDYSEIRVEANANDTARSDPIALPLLSTSALTLRASGTRHRRVEKTAVVADIPLSWQYLDVCSDLDSRGGEQCSNCMKCRRTLMALDVLGVVERYRDIFDLDHWRSIRDHYLWEVMTAKADPHKVELRDLIRARHYRIPARIVRHAGPHLWEKTTAGITRARGGVARRVRAANGKRSFPET